jgi:outer membrane lipoprotein LolB
LLYQQRAAAIGAWSRWEFNGRLSLDDGEDGGSGQLRWQVNGQNSQLDFRGPLGRGAWQLSIEPGRVVLVKADGSSVVAGSVAGIIDNEVGWRIPVKSLSYWVRGLPAPGQSEEVELDQLGRVTRLRQQGWLIDFDRYRLAAGVELPGRIEAVNGDYRVKLAGTRWLGPENLPDDA